MSIIQQHTQSSLSDAWRTINIDALDPDSSQNFDTSTLHPPLPEASEADVRGLNGQVRQLLRGGDAEGALRGCLENPVYNGSEAAKVRLTLRILVFGNTATTSGMPVKLHAPWETSSVIATYLAAI
jgi:hypothetical protein